MRYNNNNNNNKLYKEQSTETIQGHVTMDLGSGQKHFSVANVKAKT